MDFEIKCEPELDIPAETNYYDNESQSDFTTDNIESTKFILNGCVYNFREIKELSSVQVKDEPPDISAPEYRCKVCDMSFYTKRKMKSHVKIHENAAMIDIPAVINKEDEVTVCEVCSTKILSKSYSAHLKNIHKFELIKCPHCNRPFRGKVLLDRHLNKSHKVLRQCLTCNICETIFPSREELNDHIGTYIQTMRSMKKVGNDNTETCSVEVKSLRDFGYHRLDHFERSVTSEVIPKIRTSQVKLIKHEKLDEETQNKEKPSISINQEEICYSSDSLDKQEFNVGVPPFLSSGNIETISELRNATKDKQPKPKPVPAKIRIRHNGIIIEKFNISKGNTSIDTTKSELKQLEMPKAQKGPATKQKQWPPIRIKWKTHGETFSCYFCGEKFTRISDVQQHTQRVHLDNLRKKS